MSKTYSQELISDNQLEQRKNLQKPINNNIFFSIPSSIWNYISFNPGNRFLKKDVKYVSEIATTNQASSQECTELIVNEKIEKALVIAKECSNESELIACFYKIYEILVNDYNSISCHEFLDCTKKTSDLFKLIETQGKIASENIEELSKKCDDLIEMAEKKINAKKQATMADSLSRLKKLGTLPTDKVLKKFDITYLRPQVTLIEIYQFLEPYLLKYKYPGISIEMNTDQIYGTRYEDRVFTALYFKKNNLAVDNFSKFLNKLVSVQVDSLENNVKKLSDYIEPMVETWGYESLKVDNVDKDFFDNSAEKSGYEIYVLLFYKTLNKI